MTDLRIALLALAVGGAVGLATYVALYELLGWLQQRAEERGYPGLIDEARTYLEQEATP